MKNILLQLIQKSQEDNKLISISTDKEFTDKFAVGYVLNCDQETLLLNAIDPEGLNDGITLINLDDIYNVDYNDLYLNDLELLCKNAQELNKIKNIDIKIKDNIFDETLNICQKEKELIKINLIYDIGLIGYILEVDNEFVSLNNITEEGLNDGISCIRISDIERIFINDRDLKKIKLLYKHKN